MHSATGLSPFLQFLDHFPHGWRAVVSDNDAKFVLLTDGRLYSHHPLLIMCLPRWISIWKNTTFKNYYFDCYFLAHAKNMHGLPLWSFYFSFSRLSYMSTVLLLPHPFLTRLRFVFLWVCACVSACMNVCMPLGLELEVVANCLPDVGAGYWTRILWKSSMSSQAVCWGILMKWGTRWSKTPKELFL